MKNLIKTVMVAGIFFFLTSPSKAQIFDEWEARPNVSLKYKFNKKLSLGSTYYLYLDKNLGHYNKSVIGTELNYKFNSWLKAGIDYRYGIDPKQNYHDIRYSATFDINPSQKWKLAYRPMLQQEFISLKKAKLETNPVEYFWRNRFTVSYKLNNVWELYVFTENYLQIQKANLQFHRQKSAFGAELEISDRSNIGGRFEVLHKKNGKVIARPNISFSYTLGYIKKKM